MMIREGKKAIDFRMVWEYFMKDRYGLTCMVIEVELTH